MRTQSTTARVARSWWKLDMCNLETFWKHRFYVKGISISLCKIFTWRLSTHRVITLPAIPQSPVKETIKTCVCKNLEEKMSRKTQVMWVSVAILRQYPNAFFDIKWTVFRVPSSQKKCSDLFDSFSHGFPASEKFSKPSKYIGIEQSIFPLLNMVTCQRKQASFYPLFPCLDVQIVGALVVAPNVTRPQGRGLLFFLFCRAITEIRLVRHVSDIFMPQIFRAWVFQISVHECHVIVVFLFSIANVISCSNNFTSPHTSPIEDVGRRWDVFQ